MSAIHVYAPRAVETTCQLNRCPTCERDRRMLGQFYEWHGMTWTCLGCGEQWHDGEHGDREFRPGWRQENIRRARRVLASIGLQA